MGLSQFYARGQYCGVEMRANGRWIDSATALTSCPILDELMALLLDTTPGLRFNSALVNLYENGSDWLGWHSDDERCYGPDPVVASVSLGASRHFDYRSREDHTICGGVSLRSGSLLVMSGAMQHHWQHSVPWQGNAGTRINITFRWIC